MVAANARIAVAFKISGGEAHDGRIGQELLPQFPLPAKKCHLLMDKAYQGESMRQLALDLGYRPVVPPKANRIFGDTIRRCIDDVMRSSGYFDV